MLKKLKKAFTITELVIVIAVIAILAAVLIPTFANVIENANQSAALQTSQNALRDYQSIAAMDDDSDNDDMAGVVFVSDDYVYAYINSGLQYVGKLDDLTAINSQGVVSGSKWNAVAGVSFADEDTEDVATLPDTNITAPGATGYVKINLSNNADDSLNTAVSPDAISVNSLLAVDEDPDDSTKSPKRAENLYFYSIEINETYYFGWFTLETGTTQNPAYYQTQGASYSRQYGYAAVAGTPTASAYNVTVQFSATDPDTGSAG